MKYSAMYNFWMNILRWTFLYWKYSAKLYFLFWEKSWSFNAWYLYEIVSDGILCVVHLCAERFCIGHFCNGIFSFPQKLLPMVAISPIPLDMSEMWYHLYFWNGIFCVGHFCTGIFWTLPCMKYSAMEYFLFHGNSWPSNGCNIPHTVGHFCIVISFVFLESNILPMTLLCRKYSAMEYFIFHRNSWPSNGCNIPHTVGHFCNVKHFLWAPASSHNKRPLQ